VPAGLEAQADDWIHVLTPRVGIDQTAVVDWFNSEAGRAAVRRLAKGVGTLSVSKSSLAELRIPESLQKAESPAVKPECTTTGEFHQPLAVIG
jgi:hypothetical protein